MVFFCKTQLLHDPQNAQGFADSHSQQHPVNMAFGVSDADRNRFTSRVLRMPDAHQANQDQRIIRQRIDMLQKSRLQINLPCSTYSTCTTTPPAPLINLV